MSVSGEHFLFFSTFPSSCGYPGSLVRRDSTSGCPCNIKHSAGHLVVVRVVHFVGGYKFYMITFYMELVQILYEAFYMIFIFYMYFFLLYLQL